MMSCCCSLAENSLYKKHMGKGRGGKVLVCVPVCIFFFFSACLAKGSSMC